MKTPQELAFINGFCTGMHWLWTRGYVDTSDHLVEAMRDHRITVEDLKEAGADVHVVEDLKGRGAPLNND